MTSFARGGESPSDAMSAVLDPSVQAVDSASTPAAEDGEGASKESAWKAAVSAMGAGQRVAAGCALGLWFGDAVLLAPARATIGALRWWTGIGAALFVALTTALAVGAILGLVFVPMMASIGAILRSWWVRLRAGDAAALRAFSGALVGVLGLCAAVCSLSYRVSLATELGFTGPRSMAVLLTLSHFVFAGIFLFALPWSLRAGRWAVEGAEEIPGVRWVFATPWRLPAILGTVAALVGGALAYLHRVELAMLPWRSVASLPGAVFGIVCVVLVGRFQGPWGQRFARAAFALEVVGLCAGCAAALRLRPESTTARRLAFDRALSGSLGYSAWTAAFDFDRDGQIGMLGGGDCAPFDPRRYAGAVDTPGNGIDEDCDGSDLHLLPIAPRPRMRVGQDALPKRPSVVLITIDALAAPRLQSLGGRDALTPNIDALAGRSMLFTHCFSQGPSTRLSFPSIFTSHWDSQLTHLFAPVHPYAIAPSDRQLQDYLNDVGYETAAVIPDSYFGAVRWPSMTRGFQRVDSTAIPSGKNNAAAVTDAALRVLSSSSTEHPIYLWVHYYDAHSPYAAPPGTTPPNRTEEGLYESELMHIDQAIAPLLAAIEARAQPTYLILTADHATVFHPDPSTRKGHYGYDLYTATLHVPLIVRGPGISPGRADGVVSTMDVAPTIADLVRIPNEGFQGNSLLPETLAGKGDPERVIFHEFYLPERDFRGDDPLQIVSVRNAKYNLVLDRDKGMYELYDWTSDYFERQDLYEDRARTPEVLHMRALLSTFVQRFHNRWTRGTPGERLRF
ncbi:MAG TPA: sulfatase-like hydrolase/transferase [Polyangiaceae bacterium]